MSPKSPRPRRLQQPLAALGVMCLLGSAACASGAATRHEGSAAPSAASSAQRPFEAAFSPAEVDRIHAALPHVERAAATYELDPNLIHAVIWVESRFVTDARSPAGARGLMQLMPATAAELARQLGEPRARSLDPAFNVTAGSYYLRRLIDRFDGDLELALAAYNAGAGNVRKWTASGEGLPDFSRDYVAKVLAARARFEGTPVPSPTPGAAPAPAVTVAESTPANAEHAEHAEHAEPEPPPLPPGAPSVSVEADGPQDFEPVFEPHPELDANPPAPRGAGVPEDRAAEAPAAPEAPGVGAGVLPGVAD